jgi:hypothetical protein
MNRWLLFSITLTTLALAACGAPPTLTPVPPTSAPVLPASTTLPTSTPVPPTATRVPPTATPSRSASIKEIVNTVDARPASDKTFANATLGQVLRIGGQTRTGNGSAARLDFSEGSIVRLGQNTILTVEELSTPSGNPFTRLQFEAGKLWISLFGGSMDIKTPVGVATVRGSNVVIFFDPQTGILTIDCIECNLVFGPNSLTNLQRLTLFKDGHIVLSLLTLNDVRDFCGLIPEVCPNILFTLGLPPNQFREPPSEPREHKDTGPSGPEPPTRECQQCTN